MSNDRRQASNGRKLPVVTQRPGPLGRGAPHGAPLPISIGGTPPILESPNRISSSLAVEPADVDLSVQRTVRVLFVHPPTVETPLFSDRILASYGGHVFNFELARQSSLRAAADRLSADPPDTDIVLLDMSLPAPSETMNFFFQIRNAAPTLPMVVLCAAEDEALAIETLRFGVHEYLLKQDLDDRILGRMLRHALERHRLMEDIERQKRHLSAGESVSRKMVGQLREEMEKRRQTEKLKDDFINVASHEIRSPLTVIKGVLDNMKEGILGPLTGPQMNYIEITSRHADRLAKIIDNLLDMSRLESGRAKMHRGETDAGALIRILARDFQIMAKERKLGLTVEIPENLPPVYADPDMLSQVLVNLMSNAMKFAKRKILVRAEEVDQQNVGGIVQHTLLQELIGVQFTVWDDGVGISPEDMKHLFNKFAQFHRPADARGHKGTGLGLAICKDIIELHQGKIWAESKPGRGSRFHFILPRYYDEIAIHCLIDRGLADAAKNAAPMSILVLTVDNMEDIRRSLSPEELETFGRRIREEIGTRVLRKGDCIEPYPTKSAFVILVQSGMEGASSVRRRMQSRLEDLFRDWLAVRPVLSVGMAIYPADAGRISASGAPSAGVSDAGRISASGAPGAGVSDAGRISASGAPGAGVSDAGRRPDLLKHAFVHAEPLLAGPVNGNG